MTESAVAFSDLQQESQSAFVRGFIDDGSGGQVCPTQGRSQSAFVRGFIDDIREGHNPNARIYSLNPRSCAASSMTPPRIAGGQSVPVPSQSAFVRGFIDDSKPPSAATATPRRLNPRSCAASSMTSSAAP